MIIIKSEKELDYMREAGKLTALVLEKMKEVVEAGITTKELDQIAENFIRSHGGIPSFKGYHGFPASICASINNEVVHGIPGLRKLTTGDIISIDVGVELSGYNGDSAITLAVGSIDEAKAKLIKVTEESLAIGIQKAIIGNRLGDISHAIQSFVEDAGFSVVRDYVGHGIGKDMHEDPPIPNYGPPNRGPRLEEGMTLAIEPMVNMGVYQVRVLQDDWTVVTRDGKPSAHFEHTIAITTEGPEILTRI
ncbi:MAG: type I methionyl aminopeptidase [Bacillota bacterium]